MRDSDDSWKGRHRGRRRLFEAGELRLVLLALLREHPRHGYDFITDIQARAGGAYAPSPGVIYPTLTMLEELGHIRQVEADGTKRLFAITPAGATYAEERQTEVNVAMARLAALGAEHRWMDAGPVSRAMQNLKAVLHQRLAAAGADKAVLFDVAELIDEAARRIERL